MTVTFRSLVLALAALFLATPAMGDVTARAVVINAQNRFAGSEAYKVDFYASFDLYEVKLLQGNQIVKARYRASTGAFLRSSVETRQRDVQEVAAALQIAQITLIQGMDIARDRVPGFIREAEIKVRDIEDPRNGKLLNVEIIQSGVKWEVKINTVTGQVIKVQRYN